MLQSIQYIGSGPPTYIYAEKPVGSSMEFYHVFAAETMKHDGREENRDVNAHFKKKTLGNGNREAKEEIKIMDNPKTESIQQAYEREYGRRESFLWKQR